MTYFSDSTLLVLYIEKIIFSIPVSITHGYSKYTEPNRQARSVVTHHTPINDLQNNQEVVSLRGTVTVVTALSLKVPVSRRYFLKPHSVQPADNGYPATFRAEGGKSGEEEEWYPISITTLSSSYFPTCPLAMGTTTFSNLSTQTRWTVL